MDEQSFQYAKSKLPLLNNNLLPFVYESTGEITRFTDYRDPKPRFRDVFTFHRLETFLQWIKEEKLYENDYMILLNYLLKDLEIAIFRTIV